MKATLPEDVLVTRALVELDRRLPPVILCAANSLPVTLPTVKTSPRHHRGT
jgi:hypothetical protein